MESQFHNLYLSIQAQPMPPEFKNTLAIVLCHDCSAKSSTMYHWLGLKCGVCQSYNTAQLQIIGLDAETAQADLIAGRSAQVPGVTPLEISVATVMDNAVGNMRRRHSSTVAGTVFSGADLTSFPPDRLARSVSPVPTPGRSLRGPMIGGYFDLEEEEDEGGDMFGFWSRIPRRIMSKDEEDDDADIAGSSDGMTSDEDVEDDEGEEWEDDDFELLGHR